MKRLLLPILLAIVLPAHAQDRVWRVGLLSNSPPPSRVAATWRDEVLGVLRKHGFERGKNLELVDRYSDGDADRLPRLARELGAINADAIVAISYVSASAALTATRSTPLVVVVGEDPVALGLVASLARPGGRVTGIVLQTPEADAKRLQLLSEAIPGGRRFGYLGMSFESVAKVEAIRRAADRIGVALTIRLVEGPGEYAEALAAMHKEGAAGVVVGANQPLATHSAQVTAAAEAAGLPTICEWEYMARAGCLFGFGHDLAYGQRRVGEYVARILAGAQPADLPMEQSDVWTLTINLRTAKALGLTIPPSVIARADEVIE
jgi:putative tryptophan/tyrosine transport system substrate-binding protein